MDKEKLISDTIQNLESFTDEDLIYYYKCSLTKQSTKEKNLYSKLIKAIEAERKARNKQQILIEDQDDKRTSTQEE